VPADATIGWPQYPAAASGNAVLFVCAVIFHGHAQDIPDGEAGWLLCWLLCWLLAAAAELDGCAEVHADSAMARATAAPKA
jgi:hypothetical protein